MTEIIRLHRKGHNHNETNIIRVQARPTQLIILANKHVWNEIHHRYIHTKLARPKTKTCVSIEPLGVLYIKLLGKDSYYTQIIVKQSPKKRWSLPTQCCTQIPTEGSIRIPSWIFFHKTNMWYLNQCDVRKNKNVLVCKVKSWIINWCCKMNNRDTIWNLKSNSLKGRHLIS